MSTDSLPKLTFETRGNITIGTVLSANMFDTMNVAEFGNQVLDYVRDKPRLNLLLSFEKVDYLSSAALTELLRINDAVKKASGSLRLCSLTEDIRKVFEITNLDKLFVVHAGDDVQSALKRFERSLAVEANEDAWTKLDEHT